MRVKLLVCLCAAVFLAGCGSNDQGAKYQGVQESTNQFLEEGKQFLAKGDALQAIKSFDKAIQADPKNSENFIVLGQVYLRMKQYVRAVDTFLAATKVDPMNGEAHYLLSMANAARNRLDLAVPAAQKSVQLFSQQKDEEGLKKSLILLKSLSDGVKNVVNATN